MWAVETGVEDSPIRNVPSAMYWCMVTVTTVGYGDIVPKGPRKSKLNDVVRDKLLNNCKGYSSWPIACKYNDNLWRHISGVSRFNYCC